MYRAVYVAQNGEELVMAEGALTEDAAVEVALDEARRHDLIGPEWPRVTEEEFRAALRIDQEDTRPLWCPYCAERFDIDADELARLIGPGASDPAEWTPQSVADFLAEHRNHRCWDA